MLAQRAKTDDPRGRFEHASQMGCQRLVGGSPMTEFVGLRVGGWVAGRPSGRVAMVGASLRPTRGMAQSAPSDQEPLRATLQSFLTAVARFYSINNSRNQFDRAEVLRGSIGARFLCHKCFLSARAWGRTEPAHSICAPQAYSCSPRPVRLRWLLRPCEWFAMHTAATAEAV